MNLLHHPARFAAILIAATAHLHAAVSHSLDSFLETNYTATIIRSDADNANPNYNRDAIEVSADVTYTRSGASDFHYEYRFDFQLLDADDNPVILALPGNATGPTLSVLEEIDMTLGPAETTVTTFARVRPHSTVNPYVNHRVVLTIHRRPLPGGSFSDTGLTAQTTPQIYRHFTSPFSGDVPLNVIAQVNTVQWTRFTRLQTDPDENHDFFRVSANIRYDRYDKFGDAAPSGDDVPTRLTITLRDDLDNIIPLEQSTFDFVEENLPSYSTANPLILTPYIQTRSINLDVRPTGQLLSHSRTYNLQVAISHFDNPNLAFPKPGNSRTTLNATLLDFNGTLAFSGGSGTFTGFAAPLPIPLASEVDHILADIHIANNSGTFNGFTFGNPADTLTVKLRDNGVATLNSGTLTLGGSGQPVVPGNIDYTLGNVTITPTNIFGDLHLRLPSGLGLAADPDTRIHEGITTFPGINLNGQLQPADPTVGKLEVGWAAEESKPFVFRYSAILWDVDDDRIRFTPTGEIQFVRAAAYAQLENDALLPPASRTKPSNDGYYRNLADILTAEVTINTAANGSALISCDLEIDPASYTTHFPLNATVNHDGGSQRITNDLVDPTFGGLDAAANIVLQYTRDCPEAACGSPAGNATLVLIPDDGNLTFTRDGGLHTPGTLTAPATLNWGWADAANDYAHAAYTFTTANFHAPGIFLAASQHANKPAADQPARLHLTGINPDAPNTVERPATAAYTAGLGDYAGLNFRVDGFNSHTGKLVLAGQPSDPFPFTDRVKYIARFGGISGIHEATNGQFDPTATIYGMDFTFTTLGWAFLNNQAVASRTNGDLDVPHPSDFNLEFEELMITCIGALDRAEIAPIGGDGHKKLAYWNADFRPLTLGFEANPLDEDASCDASKRRLVLGVEAYAGGIAQPLSGRFGFQTNGNLVTAQSGDLGPGFDSRLRLPNNFLLAGPSGQTYRATPVGEAYLNNHDFAPDPDGFGWMNFAALLDVPFFSDIEVHLHTNAVKDDENALYHLMGGFPAPGEPNKGFSINGQNFFTEIGFDKNNRGYPSGVPIDHYRSGLPDPDDDTYRPIARKRWLNFIDLNYSLNWRAASKSFVSFKEQKRDFFVVDAAHRIDYLSPDFAEISFGGGISLIPKINIANFVADKATDVTTVLKQRLLTDKVDDGIQQLNEVLDVKQRDFFEKALFPAVDTITDEVLDRILGNWSGNAWIDTDLADVIDGGLLDPANGVVTQLTDALSAARDVGEGAVSILKEIDTRLETAEEALTLIENFTEEKDDMPLGDLQATVIALAELVSGALDKPEFAEKINALMEKAEPRIIEIRKTIVEVRQFITKVREAMDEGGAFAQQVIDIVDNSITSIESAAALVRNDIEAILNDVNTGIDNVNNLESVLRQKIKQRIHEYLLGLPVIAEFNRLIKQRLYDTSALMTEAIDEVFDQINLTLRDVIKEVAGGLDEKFEQMVGEAIGDKMASANIDGYAKIRNDSLTELRLDLKAQFSIPDEMKAHVFLVIKELSSENAPAGCAPETGRVVEVTMGAKDMAVEWLFPDTTVSIHSKFLLQADGDLPFPVLIGMGGGFDLKGEISFGESVIIQQLGASVMFSKSEAYISAGAKLEVQGFAGGGGIFIGRACSIEPFFWDPTAQAILGDPPFTGLYGYGEFWVPIPTLIGIPSTCLFNLSAGVGFGAGLFLEGPTVFGKMFLGVSGDVLCIISLTGEIILVGKASPAGLALAGEARFKGEIGYCPLCIKFNKMIRMTRENGKWSRSVK